MGLALLLPFAVRAAQEPGVDSYEEYSKRIDAAQQVEPLKDSAFGDQVSLYNGATTFEVTDVSIPGNNALAVALSRELVIEDKRASGAPELPGFADWTLGVPYIEGTFTRRNGWTLYSGVSGSTNRCSDNSDWPYTLVDIPGGTAFAPYGQVWHGNRLHVPGAGSQLLLANDQPKSYAFSNDAYSGGGGWKWVTSENWKLRCVSQVTGDLTGEGFEAVSPDGTTYRFDYAVSIPSSTLRFQYDTQGHVAGVQRVRIFLLATRVQDRFGNYVTYSYNNDDHLTRIESSDGRVITLQWSGDKITSVTSALGTWNYSYATASWTNRLGIPYSWPYLSAVTRPDGSKWTYSIDAGSLMTNKDTSRDDYVPPPNHCQLAPLPNTGTFEYTVSAPSGAVATYLFDYGRQFRSMVPLGCLNNPNPDRRYPLDQTNFFDAFYLTHKEISGPGLAKQVWDYNYNGTLEDGWGYLLATRPYGEIAKAEPYEPPGNSCVSKCAFSKVVTVTGPLSVKNYTYGVQYARNEGQLLQEQVKEKGAADALRTTTYTYVTDAAAPSQPFPDIAGYDLRPNYQDPMGNRNRPVAKTVIQQDGVDFSSTVTTFDRLARAASAIEGGTATRSISTEYADNPGLWVLGQVAKSTVAGVEAARTAYSSLAQPLRSYRFDKLVSAMAWNSDGTLHSITDGNGHATTLSNWKLGIPRSVVYADGKGQSAEVDDAGRISKVTDESGFATGYGYDPMGRLTLITYPTGDDVAWNATNLTFAQSSEYEYGIPPGHWTQTIQTGNARTITYFDALWRPLVVERYDTGNRAATLSQVVHLYDEEGREVFTSYPTHAASAFTDSLPGTYTGYDALDRTTSVSQDSELDPLLTVTAYLAGFKTKVTDPRGYVTVTGFQAFGKPDTSRPVSIVMPEGATTTITRDAFGKPLVVKRSGSYGGSTVSVTRTLVYDENQLLCKRIEPESGATLFGYDAANNMVWSAPDTTLNRSVCDRDSVSPSQKVTRTYDQRNRLASVAYPDGISNSQFTYAADGAMLSATNSNGGNSVRTDYSYDKRRLLTSETLTVPGADTFLTQYGYDANGHLGSLSYPGGRIVTFAPNALGQPTEASGYATGVLYFPNGGIKQFTYGDGSVHTLTQNLRGLPERSQDRRAGTAVLDNTLAYDQNGNVAAITDGLPGNVGNIGMVYDGLDRLTSATSPMFAGNHQANFTYDPLDNLRSAGVGNGNQYTYSYDAANRLIAMTGSQGFDFGYDARGNMTQRGAQYYSFDVANRLRAASGVESYLYDAAGRRVRKDNGVMTYFVYDKAGALLHEQGADGAGASDYVYLGGSLVAKVTKDAPPTVPDTPASITVPSSSSTGSFTVSWDSVTGATSYVLQQQFNGGSWTQQYNGSATSKAVSGLGNGSYVYRVQACNSAGCSGWRTSGTVTVTLPQAPPETPASITVPSSSSTGSFTVSWDSVTGATSYVLQQQLNGGSWTQQYNGSATSKAISGLTSGSYVYRVQACNSAGCSGWRTSGTVTVTLPQPPPIPASITVPSSSSTGSFTVSWDSATGATSYVLQQQLNGGSWTQQYNGSATSKAFSGLGNGSYVYRVQACNSAGCSGWRTSGTLTVLKVPPVPATLTVPSQAVAGQPFPVSWSASSGATSYTLKHTAIDKGTSNTAYSGPATSTTTTIPGPRNSLHAYNVKACNSAGCSGWSVTRNVYITGPGGPQAVPAAAGSSGP